MPQATFERMHSQQFRMGIAAGLLLLTLQPACSSTKSDQVPAQDASAPADSNPELKDVDLVPDQGADSAPSSPWGIDKISISWLPCSLYDGAKDGRAECAQVEMPLRWGVEDGATFTTDVKRLLSSAAKSEGQLWLLHGGPGGAGTVGLPSMMEMVQQGSPELDLYTLDPRGAGRSDWLGCPQDGAATDQGSWISESEFDGCLEHVKNSYTDRLDVYNTTNSAIDLAALIHAERAEGKKVLIWGGSGGTFWAQRYLQFFPEQADGVVLEGIVPPVSSLMFQDEYDDKIARAILKMCQADSFCAGKLPDPEATLAGLYDKIEGGHCPALGITVHNIKSTIRTLNYFYPTNLFSPAFIYRLDRCNEEDIQALLNFFKMMWGKPETPFSFSTVLFFNEGFSELWEHPDFVDNTAILAYLDQVHEQGLITMKMGYTRNDYYLKWPRYTDQYDDTWAESDVPMLMLQGKIDPSTPHFFAEAVGQHFSGEHQHWVSFPFAPHNVIAGTPLTIGVDAQHCARQLFIAFLKDPKGGLDTSCVDKTVPLDFEGRAWAPFFTKTADLFDNEPPPGGQGSGFASLPAPLREALGQLGLRLRRTAMGNFPGRQP